MKKGADEEMNQDQRGQGLAETDASNTGHDSTETSESDGLRAYVPAGAAMALAAPQEEEACYDEDDEDEIDADEEEQSDDPIEGEVESVSAAFTMRDYAEKDFIDETVQTINSMYRKNVDNGKIEIGTYLLDKMFKGNIEEAMSTNPQKHKTFSQIIKRTDLLVEPKTLGSWVRAAAAMKGLQKRGINLPSLTTYHYVELATVRDEEKRIEVAKRAELEKMTVKALREAIRKTNGNIKTDAEKLKEAVEKSVRQFKDLSQEEGLADFASDIEAVKAMFPAEKAVTLLPAVKTCLTNISAQRNLFKEFHASLRSIVDEAMVPLSD